MELAAVGKATIRLTDEQRADLAKQLGAEDMSELPETVDIARYDVGEEEEVSGFSFFSPATSAGPALSFSVPNIRPSFGDIRSLYIPV
jgi:hypothetical protein